MKIPRRRLVLLLGGTAVLGAGCMSKPLQRASPDGTYCYRAGKSYRPTLTCTPSPIPGEEAASVAKRFEPAADRLTVYVVRKRWADSKGLVRVGAEGGPSVDTIPQSLARLHLAAGSHRLAATWSEGKTGLEISGRAGDIVYVELVGTAWSWGSSFGLEVGVPSDSRKRAERLPLVGDVS
jgi:hypothetical protein